MTLGELVARGALYVNDGYRTKASELGADGVAILRVAEVRDGWIEPSLKDRVRPEFRSKIGPKLAKVGDVLVTTKGTVGRAAMVTPDLPELVYSPQLCVLRVTDESVLDRRWLYAWVRSPQFQRQARVVADQTDMAPYINLVDLRRMTLTMPSLAEQGAIAEVLTAIDAKIEVHARLVALVVDLAIAVYSQAVSADADLVPLGNVGRWLSGGTPKTSEATYWGGELPWISAASLKSFFVATSDRTLTSEGAQSGTRLVPAGAILFVVRGMSLKSEFRVGVAQREVAFGQDCKAIIVDDRYPAHTVAVGLAAARDAVLGLVDEAGHGTGRLPTDRIERLEIPLPPPDKRPAIEESLCAILTRGAAAEEESRRLVALRDALLSPLVSGQLKVRQTEAQVEEMA